MNRLLTLLLSAGVAMTLLGCGPVSEECDLCAGQSDCTCPPDEPVTHCVADPAPASTPAVVMGYQDGKGFVALESGGAVPVQFGAQGGSHVDAAVRIYAGGMAIRQADVSFVATDYTAHTIAAVEICTSWSEVLLRVFDPPGGAAMMRVDMMDADGAVLGTEELPVELQ